MALSFRLSPKGNKIIFVLFLISNVLLMALGLAIMAAGIYLFVLTSEANAFNFIFLFLGIIVCGLGVFSFRIRRSLYGLTFYLLMMSFILLAQIIVSVVLVCKKDAVIGWALNNTDSKKSVEELKNVIESDFDTTKNLLIVCCALFVYFIKLIHQFVVWLLGWWYRKSLKDALDKDNYQTLVYALGI